MNFNLDLNFASPHWLWALAVLPLLALLRVRSHLRSEKSTKGIIAPRLRSQLVVGVSPALRWVIFSVQLLALAFLILALARPQYGYVEAEAQSEGRNVIIAIDTSRSMLANDLLPDRLTRAKLASVDIIRALPEDRFGLIAFAGRSFLQAPLTMDHDAVIESIEQLDTEIIPRGGTNISSAVRLALDTLDNKEGRESALIIFSDGEDLEGGEEIKQLRTMAASMGMTIVSVGVGTVQGSIIPDPAASQPGVFIQDEQGQIVRSRLNPEALKQFAAGGEHSIYISIGATTSVTEVVEKALEQIESYREKAMASRRPIERFVIPLLLSLVLFVTAFLLPSSVRAPQRATGPAPSASRRGAGRGLAGSAARVRTGAAVSALAMGLFLVASSGNANAVESGLKAFQAGEYQQAIENYNRQIAAEDSLSRKAWLNFGMGSAAYRIGDYQKAKEAFGNALALGNSHMVENSHYNLGNTLYRDGEARLSTPNDAVEQWKAAIEHYESALHLNPGNENAQYNLEVVKKRLEELEKQQQEQEQKKDEEKEKEKEKEEEEEEEKEEEKEDDQKQQNEQNNQQDKPESSPDQQDKNNEQDKDNQDPNQDPNQNQDQNQDPNKDKQDDRNQDKNQDPGQDKNDSQEPQSPENNDPNKDNDSPQDQDQNPQGNNNQDSQPPQGDDQKDQQPPQGQPQQPEGRPEDQKPKDDSGQDDKDKQEAKPQQGDPQQANPQDSKPAEEEPQGELEANPQQGQPQQAQPQQGQPGQQQPAGSEQASEAAQQAAQQMNPATGFSPAQARQLLRSLSDEDEEVRPVLMPATDQPFRNW